MEAKTLALYLGCDCEALGLYQAKLVGIYPSEVEEGKTICLMPPERQEFYIEDVKPILRPLSSMTEEEMSALKKAESKWSSDNILPNIPVGRMLVMHTSQRSVQMTNWLRERFFDCDGLIESGQALVQPNK